MSEDAKTSDRSAADEADAKEVSQRMEALAGRMITWMLVGNGAALALLYNAVTSGSVDIEGARLVAGIFSLGLVACFIGCYNLLSGDLTHLKRLRGVFDGKANKKLDKNAGWSAAFLVASAVCFVAGITAPITGLLSLTVID